jgi:hypothetical protein
MTGRSAIRLTDGLTGAERRTSGRTSGVNYCTRKGLQRRAARRAAEVSGWYGSRVGPGGQLPQNHAMSGDRPFRQAINLTCSRSPPHTLQGSIRVNSRPLNSLPAKVAMIQHPCEILCNSHTRERQDADQAHCTEVLCIGPMMITHTLCHPKEVTAGLSRMNVSGLTRSK